MMQEWRRIKVILQEYYFTQMVVQVILEEINEKKNRWSMRTVSEKSRDKIFSFISHVICTRNRGKQRCYWGPCGMLSRNKVLQFANCEPFLENYEFKLPICQKTLNQLFLRIKQFFLYNYFTCFARSFHPTPTPNKHPVGVKASITIRIPFTGRHLSILGLRLWLLIVLFYFHNTVLHVCSI